VPAALHPRHGPGKRPCSLRRRLDHEPPAAAHRSASSVHAFGG
jgi:hypothetical protein